VLRGDIGEHVEGGAAVDLGAAHRERGLPRGFDQVENLFARLLADGIAENPAEEAHVVAHGLDRLRQGVVAFDFRGDHRSQRVGFLRVAILAGCVGAIVYGSHEPNPRCDV
jgi:hypothetical protein